jgi:hypothetical protein
VQGIGIYAGATAVSALLTLLLTRVLWQGLSAAVLGLIDARSSARDSTVGEFTG